MKILIALSVSILIHLGAFFYFKNHTLIQNQEYKSYKDQNHKKTNIKYVKIKPKPKTKEAIKKSRPKPKRITKPQINKKVKEIISNKKPKPISKPIIKHKPQPIKKNIQEHKLEELPPEFQELYKEDFKTLPKESKVFLIKHVKDIGRITERYLEYPLMSVQGRQQGINAIQFILYPNGKITNPVIIRSSNYFLLDDNTHETIQAAYHDYPRPSKPTLIRIYVKYSLRLD